MTKQVYVAVSGQYAKVGISNNPERRMKELSGTYEMEWVLFASMNADDATAIEARIIEWATEEFGSSDMKNKAGSISREIFECKPETLWAQVARDAPRPRVMRTDPNPTRTNLKLERLRAMRPYEITPTGLTPEMVQEAIQFAANDKRMLRRMSASRGIQLIRAGLCNGWGDDEGVSLTMSQAADMLAILEFLRDG